jgi:hypothetical protein
MEDRAARIEALQARIAELEAARAADEELQLEPEPGAVLYGTSLHPDLAHERILASGHGAGGHAGLGAAASN